MASSGSCAEEASSCGSGEGKQQQANDMRATQDTTCRRERPSLGAANPRLPEITRKPRDYPRLPEITRDYPRLPEMTTEMALPWRGTHRLCEEKERLLGVDAAGRRVKVEPGGTLGCNLGQSGV